MSVGIVIGILVLVSGAVLATESNSGFSEAYADAARLVCTFREGPLVRFVDYSRMDPDASFRGTRNFFVAAQIFGKAHACTEAFGAYGPEGLIVRGLLDGN